MRIKLYLIGRKIKLASRKIQLRWDSLFWFIPKFVKVFTLLPFITNKDILKSIDNNSKDIKVSLRKENAIKFAKSKANYEEPSGFNFDLCTDICKETIHESSPAVIEVYANIEVKNKKHIWSILNKNGFLDKEAYAREAILKLSNIKEIKSEIPNYSHSMFIQPEYGKYFTKKRNLNFSLTLKRKNFLEQDLFCSYVVDFVMGYFTKKTIYAFLLACHGEDVEFKKGRNKNYDDRYTSLYVGKKSLNQKNDYKQEERVNVAVFPYEIAQKIISYLLLPKKKVFLVKK